MNKMYLKYFTNGIIKQNPALVLILGVCPALAVTNSAINAASMGIATTFVLLFSNFFISAFKNLIPERVRIPSFIIIIGTFVTISELILQAYFQRLYNALGIYIPLIVVNCIILCRAEVFAKKNNIPASILDGLGMGIGFTLALIIIGSIREIFGNGSIFDFKFVSEDARTITIFILPPAAFIIYGYLIALMNFLKNKYKI